MLTSFRTGFTEDIALDYSNVTLTQEIFFNTALANRLLFYQNET